MKKILGTRSEEMSQKTVTLYHMWRYVILHKILMDSKHCVALCIIVIAIDFGSKRTDSCFN